ncbi:MAG: hypothetical protein ACREDR_19885 [Blastocatellia bacterium]
MEPLTIDFLIEHDQEALYETRDHIRELIATGQAPDSRELAIWMVAEFSESWRDFEFAPNGLRDEQWRELAENCIADTLEVVEYERAHKFPTEP